MRYPIEVKTACRQDAECAIAAAFLLQKMKRSAYVSDSVVWVGASDRRLALFENLFPIPRGVSYNSYLILDEKTALLDTTDASVTRQYLENVSHSLNGKPLDYLIINHMEPDHCANIAELLLR